MIAVVQSLVVTAVDIAVHMVGDSMTLISRST